MNDRDVLLAAIVLFILWNRESTSVFLNYNVDHDPDSGPG